MIYKLNDRDESIQGSEADHVQETKKERPGGTLLQCQKASLTLNPIVFEVGFLVIKCLMNLQKDSNEIGQNNAS